MIQPDPFYFLILQVHVDRGPVHYSLVSSHKWQSSVPWGKWDLDNAISTIIDLIIQPAYTKLTYNRKRYTRVMQNKHNTGMCTNLSNT